MKVETKTGDSKVAAGEESVPDHYFYAICWRGTTCTVNVMCGKTDVEAMKHQLGALNVLRPKIAAIRRIFPDTPVAGEAEAEVDASSTSMAVDTVVSTDVVTEAVVESEVKTEEIKDEAK